MQRSQATVQSIPFNAVISGSIDEPGEIDLFSFSALAGQEVTLWGNWSGGLTAGQIAVLAPDGTTLTSAEGNNTSLLADVAMPLTGIYAIRIRAASTSPFGQGAYQFTISDPETATEAIAYGQTLTHSIAVRGDDHEWQFDAVAGDLVSFSYQGPKLTGGIRFVNPDGTTEMVLPGGTSVVRFATAVAQTGTYLFSIDDDNSTGSYTIRLDQGSFADEVAGAYNTVQNATLDRLYDIDLFRYSLQAGDEITVFGSFGGIARGQVRLLDAATGVQLVEPAAGSTGQFTYVADAGRDVLVEVRGSGNFQTGNYTLTVSDPATVHQTIVFGDELAGSIAVRGDHQEWQFTGTGGERITLGYRGPHLEAGLMLLRPDGSTLATGTADSTIVLRDLLLDQPGIYRFVITDYNSTGAYTLNLSNPADIESPPATIGANTPVTDAVGTVFDVDVYSFAATAGESFSVVGDWLFGGSAIGSARIELLDPSGAIAGSTQGGNASSLLIGSADEGTYTIVVRAPFNDDFRTGDYRLTIYSGAEDPSDDTIAIAKATGIDPPASGSYEGTGTIGDSSHGVRDVDMLRLEARRGDQITVDVRKTAGSSLNTYVRLFDASGAHLAANDNFGGTYSLLTYTVLTAGTYYVGISSSGNSFYNPNTAGSGGAGAVGSYTVSIDVATDFAGPTVTSITPSGLSTSENITQFVVQFNERLNPTLAGDPASYVLISSGNDGIFGTGDDQTIALTASYDDVNRRVTLTTLDGPDADTSPDALPLGYGYRLTVLQAITDLAGNALNDGADHTSTLELVASIPVPTTTFPFLDGFESGTLGSHWSVATTGASSVTIVETGTPHAGTQHVLLSNNGAAGRATLILSVDLSALAADADVDLSFFHRESDGNNSMPSNFAGRSNSDGVAVSVDGVNWLRAAHFGDVARTSYGQVVVDLDGLLRSAGLWFTPQFQIMFQHYLGNGNNAYFDDIRLAPDLAGPTIIGVSTPGPFVFAESINSITVDFSEPLQALTANSAGSYQLRRTDVSTTITVGPVYDELQRRVTLSTAALGPGTYELRVRGDSSVGGTTQVRDANGNLLNNGADSVFTFEIIAPESPANDEMGTATATPLVSGGSYSVDSAIGNNAFGSRDVDLYRFTAAAGDALEANTINFVFSANRVNTLLRLFDAAGNELARNDDTGGSYDSRITGFIIPAAGVYYIGVSSSVNAAYNPAIAPTGVSGAIGKYRLSMSLTTDNTAPRISSVIPHAGPNSNQSIQSIVITWSEAVIGADAAERFQLLSLGADGALGGDDDVAYSFTAGYDAATRRTTLTLISPEDGLPLAEGAYRLLIHGATPIRDIAGNSLNGGTVLVHLFQVIRPESPLNDRMADAIDTGIEANGGSFTASGSIGDNALEARDVDLYRLAAREGVRLTITLDDFSIGSPLNGRVRLFNSAGQQIAVSQATSADDVLTFNITAEDVYYVGISGSGNNNYNPASPGSGVNASTTGEYILNIVSEDITDPAVTTITPSDILIDTTSQFTIQFSEPINVTAAESGASYRIAHAGPDGTLDTADDVTLSFTPVYDVATRRTTLQFDNPLPHGRSRLTLIAANLVDRAGRALNGGANLVHTVDALQTGVSLPYLESFDSAPLNANWLVRNTDADARVQITTLNTPRQGAAHLRMSSAANYLYVSSAVILPVDTAGASALNLSFFAKRGTNETNYSLPATFTGTAPGDGVAISTDGVNWYRVVDLSAQAGTNYDRYVVDLTAAAANSSLALGGVLLVRFSNTEYYAFDSTYARYFDDIRVVAGPVAPVITGLGEGTMVSVAGTPSFHVKFTEALDSAAATVPANYQLVRAGADRLLGTADDVAVALSGAIIYDPATGVLLTLDSGTLFEQDAYRLTVLPTLTGSTGLALNDGLAQSLSFDMAASEAAENDSLSSATETNLAGGVDGIYSIASAVGNNSFGPKDIDLYRVDARTGQRLKINLVRYGHNNSPLALRLFDASGVELDEVIMGGASTTLDLSRVPVGIQTFYIGVSAAGNISYSPADPNSGSAAGIGLYRLSIETSSNAALPPLADGFEEPALSQFWTTYTSDGSGLVAPVNYRVRTGSQSLVLGDTDFAYSLVEATLTVDLTALPHTDLGFWARRANNEPMNTFPAAGESFTGHYNGDGVAISVDGQTWHSLLSFYQVYIDGRLTHNAWSHYTIDLNAAAALLGITLTDTTQIRFQNYAYGNASASSNSYGIYIDDLRLDADLISPAISSTTVDSGLIVAADVSSLLVNFSEPVDPVAAADPARYELRSAGPDGVIGNSDDVIVTVVAAYDDPSHSVTLTPDTPLANGVYRLRVHGSINDLAGNVLNDGVVRDYSFAVFAPEAATDNTIATASDTGVTGAGGQYFATAMLGNDTAGPDATFDDVDLYRFEAAAGQPVQVHARSGFGSPNLRLRLFDSAGAPITFLDPSGNDALLDQFVISLAGTYYIGVSDSDNDTYDPIEGGGDAGATRGLYTILVRTLTTAAFPFTDAFEAGSLGAAWEVFSHNGGIARIEGVSPVPINGDYSAILSKAGGNGNAQTDLTLTVDLTGATNVELRFAERNNYFSSGSGVSSYTNRRYGATGLYISADGNTFIRVPGVFDTSSGTHFRIVDLDEFAAINGLALGANTKIRFQSYHQFFDSTLGRSLDDVQLILDQTGPAITRIATDGNSTAPERLNNEVTQFIATFNDRLATTAANNPLAYSLMFTGPDGLFDGEESDTGDDQAIPFTLSYDGHFVVTVNVVPGVLPLEPGRYRILFRGAGDDAITDAEGNPLRDGADEVFEYNLIDGGPEVISTMPDYGQTLSPADGFSQFTITFNEPVLPGSFDGSDIFIYDRNGYLAADQGSIVIDGDGTEWTVSFPAIHAPGEYSINVGPDITDLAGNAMNQNHNGTNGEFTDYYYFQVNLSDTGSTQLTDEQGFIYDVYPYDGRLRNGGRVDPGTGENLDLYAYSSMYYNADYWGGGSYALEDDGRTVVLPATDINGMLVHREIYVPETGGQFARFLDVLHNPNGYAVKQAVTIYGYLNYEDENIILTADSSGNGQFDTADTYVVTDGDGDGGQYLSLGHIIGDGTRLRPTSAQLSLYGLLWSYEVIVEPGQTVRLMTVATQQLTRAAAQSMSSTLAALPAALLANLSDEEKASIINFNIGLDEIGPTVTSSLPDDLTPLRQLSDIELTFSEPLDPTSATAASSYAFAGAGPDGLFGTADDLSIALTPAYNATLRQVTLEIDPAALPLTPGQYMLSVHGAGGVTDLAGNHMAEAHTPHYVIADHGPRIINQYPPAEAYIDPAIGFDFFDIFFDRPVDPTTFDLADIELLDPDGNPVMLDSLTPLTSKTMSTTFAGGLPAGAMLNGAAQLVNEEIRLVSVAGSSASPCAP